jgi:hypothetical protein
MKNNERVTLQYSISLEELPKEMRRLAEKVTAFHNSELSKKFNRFETFSDEELLSPAFLAIVEDLRNTLFRVDSTCSDMQNILTGFLNIDDEQAPQAQKRQPAQPDPEPVSAEADVPPTVPFRTVDPLNFNAEEIAGKLAAFKEQLLEVNDANDGFEEQESSKDT